MVFTYKKNKISYLRSKYSRYNSQLSTKKGYYLYSILNGAKISLIRSSKIGELDLIFLNFNAMQSKNHYH